MTLPALKVSCYDILRSINRHPLGFPALQSPTDGNITVLGDAENALLKQYDRYLELALERNLLEAEIEAIEQGGNDEMDVDTPRTIPTMDEDQRLLSEAKAKVIVKDKVVEAAIITRPIQHAVHFGHESLSIERNLLPYVIDRDRLSSTLLHHTAQLTALREATDTTTAKLLETNAENRELAGKLIKARKLNEITGTTEKMIDKEKVLRTERRKYDMVRGVVQGIIVGSGVDWSRDDRWREVVLGCGDDVEV